MLGCLSRLLRQLEANEQAISAWVWAVVGANNNASPLSPAPAQSMLIYVDSHEEATKELFESLIEALDLALPVASAAIRRAASRVQESFPDWFLLYRTPASLHEPEAYRGLGDPEERAEATTLRLGVLATACLEAERLIRDELKLSDPPIPGRPGGGAAC